MCNQPPVQILEARFSCFPQSERLCLVCPQVSVSVHPKLVERVDRSLLSTRNCCHLSVLLSRLLSVEVHAGFNYSHQQKSA
jgi:hypothetical protein